jgi:lipopolysaccharide/colanic/teichoic acid biosynthesis glycosyltransferase
MLILLLPVFTSVALTIAMLSGRRPIVKHKRIGRFAAPFAMLKFRTMWGGDTAELPAHEKLVHDPRVTSRFARFCRRYSVDELPQLIHVMSGSMAFVGPRPLTQSELDRYYGGDAAEVLSVRPGLTGLWQVMGRSRLTYHQRRRLDLFLVRHRLVRLHARILLWTIPQVIRGKDSW